MSNMIIRMVKQICFLKNIVNVQMLKFMQTEKAQKFYKIFTLLLTGTTQSKSKVEILQNFVAFSEYMNFTCSPTKKQTFLRSCDPRGNDMQKSRTSDSELLCGLTHKHLRFIRKQSLFQGLKFSLGVSSSVDKIVLRFGSNDHQIWLQ